LLRVTEPIGVQTPCRKNRFEPWIPASVCKEGNNRPIVQMVAGEKLALRNEVVITLPAKHINGQITMDEFESFNHTRGWLLASPKLGC
jgi:hypothetical protein